MYKKNIKHLATISLKYFFDFDYSVFDSTALFIVSLARSLKVIIIAIAQVFYDGAVTVKEDILDVKTAIITYKEFWDNSDIRENLVTNIRSLRNNFVDKDGRIWRL